MFVCMCVCWRERKKGLFLSLPLVLVILCVLVTLATRWQNILGVPLIEATGGREVWTDWKDSGGERAGWRRRRIKFTVPSGLPEWSLCLFSCFLQSVLFLFYSSSSVTLYLIKWCTVLRTKYQGVLSGLRRRKYTSNGFNAFVISPNIA